MTVILANIAVWGLLFAVLNLIVATEKHLRDPDKPRPIKVVVIVGAVILLSYAFAIGGLAVGLLLGGAEVTPATEPSG